jgi:hypothetical protein
MLNRQNAGHRRGGRVGRGARYERAAKIVDETGAEPSCSASAFPDDVMMGRGHAAALRTASDNATPSKYDEP